MKTSNLVREALKHKAPELMAELQSSGNLEAFIMERSEEISSLTTSLAHQIAVKQGMNEVQGMERTAIYNAALHQAREIVLAEQLEFPPEETSRPSQD